MELSALLQQIEAASGADKRLDQAVTVAFNSGNAPEALDYTASVEHCLDLVRRVLPDWAWHVGFGANGVFPYATLHDDTHATEASAPTVPLALLAALTKAKIEIGGDAG